MKGTTGRHEEFGGTPSWAVLLAAVVAVAVSVSLAHPGAASRAHPRTAQLSRSDPAQRTLQQ
jgi:hypothetical protein